MPLASPKTTHRFVRRTQNTSIALLGVTLPFLVACLAMFIVIWQRERFVERPVGPNPQKEPAWMLGPTGLLVYTDPRWAGVILPLMSIAVPPIVLFIVATPFVWPVGLSGQSRRLGPLVAVSLTVGFAVAAPWLLGLVRLLR